MDWKHARHLPERLLVALADGEMTAEARQAAEAHLDACAACRSRLAAVAAEPSAVRALVASAPFAGAGDGDENEARAARIEALKRTLAARLPDAAAAIDRSWRDRIARACAGVPAPALLAGAIIVVAVAGRAWIHASAPRAHTAHAAIEPGDLPRRALTPGATTAMTAAELCGRRIAVAAVPAAMRRRVVDDYGVERVPPDQYELDYLITPALGGATDARNLWPERYGSRAWNAHVKDQLEDLLPRLVCQGTLDLSTAQRDIAIDWIAAYKKYFHTDRPLVRSAAWRDDDDDDVGVVGAAASSNVSGLSDIEEDASLCARPAFVVGPTLILRGPIASNARATRVPVFLRIALAW